MDNIFLISFIISFVCCSILMMIFIPCLKRWKIGQYIRKEGPQEHLKKQGIPTFGGLIIFLSAFIGFFYINIYYKMFEVRILLIIFLPLFLSMMIGFIDDYLKIVKKNNLGLKPSLKLLLQVISIIIFLFIFYKYDIIQTKIYLFRTIIDIKYLYVFLFIIIFLSSMNALNLSDGLDGLASGLMIITFIALGIISYILKEGVILLSIITLLASTLAFFIYNCNPARIFMGDSGSLFLGAALALYSILLKVEILLLLIGLPYLIETLSVIIQVIYFKLSHGKRIFLMSPLHHHLELKGYKEWTIDIMFWIFGLIVSILSIVLVLNR